MIFLFHEPPTTEIYTLSLHDALPISLPAWRGRPTAACCSPSSPSSCRSWSSPASLASSRRSEEHTSELQSLTNLVCRLLLEKKKSTSYQTYAIVPTQ